MVIPPIELHEEYLASGSSGISRCDNSSDFCKPLREGIISEQRRYFVRERRCFVNSALGVVRRGALRAGASLSIASVCRIHEPLGHLIVQVLEVDPDGCLRAPAIA